MVFGFSKKKEKSEIYMVSEDSAYRSLRFLSALTKKESLIFTNIYNRIYQTNKLREQITSLYSIFNMVGSNERRWINGKNKVKIDNSLYSILEPDTRKEFNKLKSSNNLTSESMRSVFRTDLNLKIDSYKKSLKINFRDLFDKESDELSDVISDIEIIEKRLEKTNLIEQYNYKKLYKFVKGKLNDLSSEDIKQLTKEKEKVMKQLNLAFKEIDDRQTIKQLDITIKNTIKNFRDMVNQEKVIVKKLIKLLDDLQIKDNEWILHKGELTEDYISRHNALQLEIKELKDLIDHEKTDVFDVLNEVMKKKRDMYSVFEQLVYEKDGELLTIEDVEFLYSCVTNIEEGFDLMKEFMEFKDSFFDNDAKEYIIEEYSTLKKFIKNVRKDAILSNIDALTKLPNSRAYLSRIKELQEIVENENRSSSKKPSEFSFIFLDIDFFKTVNEVYGHGAGDIILKNVATLLDECVKSGIDAVYRKGGEEFVAIVKGNSATAMKVTERMRSVIEMFNPNKFKITNLKHRKEFWLEGKLRVIKDKKIFYYNPDKKRTTILNREKPKDESLIRILDAPKKVVTPKNDISQYIVTIDAEGKETVYRANKMEELPQYSSKGIIDYSKLKKECGHPITFNFNLGDVPPGTSERPWITVSFGIATYPDHGLNIEELSEKADKAAVASKTKGRNTISIANK